MTQLPAKPRRPPVALYEPEYVMDLLIGWPDWRANRRRAARAPDDVRVQRSKPHSDASYCAPAEAYADLDGAVRTLSPLQRRVTIWGWERGQSNRAIAYAERMRWEVVARIRWEAVELIIASMTREPQPHAWLYAWRNRGQGPRRQFAGV